MRTLTRVAASAGALALITGAIELLKGHVPVLSLAVLYLLAIIPVAVAWGTVYAVGTAIGSMLAFNFFFVEPLYTFTIADTKNWFALLVFLVTAVVVSELATRSRRRAEEAEAALGALRRLTEERERLASEALEAEALRRSDALKTALLRSVSHDLRSPLTAILASADALASPGLTLAADDRLGLAETIRSEATRLDRVVEQLLDLSRLEAGAAEPHRELWHVDELVGQALAGLGAEAGRVRLDIGSETPPVEVDAAQIERVLANLLENALRSPRRCCFGSNEAPPSSESTSSTPAPACPTSSERRCSSRFGAGRPDTAPGSASPSRAGSRRRTAGGSGRRTTPAEATSCSRSRWRSAGRRYTRERSRPRRGRRAADPARTPHEPERRRVRGGDGRDGRGCACRARG